MSKHSKGVRQPAGGAFVGQMETRAFALARKKNRVKRKLSAASRRKNRR